MAEQHEKALVPQIRFAGFADPWEQRKLGELYEKNDERNTFGLGAERTLSIATMTFNSEGNGADASSLPNYKVIRVGDVAFEGHSNKSFAYGRFVVNAVADGIMSPRFSCLRPKNSYPVRFWKYYIHSEQVMREILVRATKSGTMMNELVIDDLFKQSIAVPQEAEQQAIGYFFSHLDTLITLHQRKYGKLVVFKKSMLEKMFPKDGESVPEIRFAGFTDPWEQRKFSDIVNVCSGKDYKHLEEGPIPVYGTGGFMTSVDEALSYDRDAVGIGRKGTIDKPYLLKAPFWTVDTLFYAIPKSDMDLEFVHCSFLNVDWKSRDESTGLPSLSKEAINETIALVPSFNEQSRIGEFFNDLDSLITLHQRKLELLQNIKKSLLDKMFV